MALEDSERPGYSLMVIGSWQGSDDLLDINYAAPLSGETRILHLVSEKDHLTLTGASKEDGEVIEIGDLAGARFIRGELYSAPVMDHQPISLV